MKKWLVGLTCVVLGLASAQADLSSPATLPVEYAGANGWSNANLDAMTGWDASGLGTPYATAAKLDTAGDNIVIYFDSAPGEIVYSVRRSDGAALAGTYEAKVQESADTNAWTDVRTFNGSELNGTLALFTNTLSSASRYVRFIYVTKPTGQNFGVGYVKIASGGAAVFSVNLDKSNGFTVEQGSSSTITATAANGTAPYSYSWASTLGASFYSTNANVFTILATAPTGSYSATATATDSALLTTNKTVTFSVVAPATKYAITITPPTNGTVTTTPATNAAGGTIVTIQATPAGGYTVASYSVVGADTTVIGTTSSFIMPDQAVTVTVTFQEASASGALIISQYYEGSGTDNKWIEIYNPGSSAIDLAAGGYRLGTWNNAIREGWKTNGGATLTVVLSNAIPAGGTYLISPAGATLPAYVVASQTAALAFNGDDSVVLYTGTPYAFANVVDAFGVTNTATSFGENKSFVRTNTVTSGVNGDFNPAEWIQFTTNAVDNAAEATNERLGYHSTGAAVFTVTLDKSNGFTVDQGSSSTITATAANGTAPYSYAWTSTLGASFYSTNANVFTILATAPTGSYSATATATDSALLTTNKTVTFSVVAPATKYAITITPPVNGTVTTTPATNAAAGATVTINATPAGGYAIGTYSVVGADTTVIGTTSSFVMPAQGVTVTVTFVPFTDVATLPINEVHTNTFDWTTLPGWSGVSMSTYSDGDMSFNATADSLTVNFDAAPGTLAFSLQGRTSTAGTAPMSFLVEESANGTTWTTVTNINETMVSTAKANFGPYALQSASRYVRWTLANKFSFNLGLNDVVITSSGAPTPAVNIAGNLAGTVGQGMNLSITVTNETATDWFIDLKDPDMLDDITYDFNNPPVFLFTPTKVGTYTLTATAQTGTGNYSNTVQLTVSAAAANPPIASITFVAGTGFTFQVPAGFNLVRVEGADTAVAGNALTWLPLSTPTDYSVSGTTVTIKSAAAMRRLVRIVLTPQ